VHPSSLSSHHERAWLANSSSGPTCSAPPAQAATRDLARTEDGWNSCCSTQRKDGGSPARRNELHSSWWRRGRRRDLLGEQEHWETGVLNSCELATASCWPRPPAPVVACFPRRTTAAARRQPRAQATPRPRHPPPPRLKPIMSYLLRLVVPHPPLTKERTAPGAGNPSSRRRP
jgi:hypothetical protein